ASRRGQRLAEVEDEIRTIGADAIEQAAQVVAVDAEYLDEVSAGDQRAGDPLRDVSDVGAILLVGRNSASFGRKISVVYQKNAQLTESQLRRLYQCSRTGRRDIHRKCPQRPSAEYDGVAILLTEPGKAT